VLQVAVRYRPALPRVGQRLHDHGRMLPIRLDCPLVSDLVPCGLRVLSGVQRKPDLSEKPNTKQSTESKLGPQPRRHWLTCARAGRHRNPTWSTWQRGILNPSLRLSTCGVFCQVEGNVYGFFNRQSETYRIPAGDPSRIQIHRAQFA
jgi:hypothetical protein